MSWDSYSCSQGKVRNCLFYGDSLTAPGHGTWPGSVTLLLMKDAPTINRGTGGFTTDDILARLRGDIAATPIYTYYKKIFWGGSNDMVEAGWDGSKTLANIQSMFETCQSNWYRFIPILPRGDIDCTLGSKIRETMDSVNTQISKMVGAAKFESDLLSRLQAANNGSAKDLSDVASGLVPTSLRVDTVHLTTNVAASPDSTTGNGIVYLTHASSVQAGW